MRGFLVLLALFSVGVNAGPMDKLEKCREVASDKERLACYDLLLTPITSTPSRPGYKGDWDVRVKVNPLDDSKTVTLFLDASTGESRWRKKTLFVARCMSNKTEAYVSWGDFLGSDNPEVITRVGTDPAAKLIWDISSDSKSTFHRKPIQFLKRMMEHNKLVLQVTPYNENPVTAVFNTAGLSEAVKPLRETCGW